ncbi:MAG: BON domain-containing protein [Planctomycetaceae bacterium]
MAARPQKTTGRSPSPKMPDATNPTDKNLTDTVAPPADIGAHPLTTTNRLTPLAASNNPCSSPHSVECEVQRLLLGHPDLQFTQLSIHRIKGGVCLDGILASPGHPDIPSIVRQVSGVTDVIDHLLYRTERTE